MSRFLNKVFKKIRTTFFPSEHDREYKKWLRDGGDENLRFEYDLSADSLVIDLGGYKGQWTSDIYSRYNCRVLVFEPLPSFAEGIEHRFGRNSKITVFRIALGKSRRQEYLTLANDSSSIYLDYGEKVAIQIEDVADFFERENILHCELMKINIEGGEYELLERMIETGLLPRIKSLQIQFHKLGPQSDNDMQRICTELSKTHRPTYRYKYIWENWVRQDT